MTKLTDDDMNDLVEAWHDGRAGQGMSMEEFIQDSTGLNDEQYRRWVINGDLPWE